MGTYSYTFVSTIIPPIPLIPIKLIATTPNSPLSIDCQAILDTGSDCTLVPIPLVMQVNGKAGKNSIRLPFGGKMTLGISYEVGLIFDKYNYSTIEVFACSVDELGELLIIGRDIMNKHRIEFDGCNLTFTIF